MGKQEANFREKMGFLVLCLIGFYCTMNMMVMLKAILQPFLWAMFFVMGLMPAVDLVEAFVLQFLCCEPLPARLEPSLSFLPGSRMFKFRDSDMLHKSSLEQAELAPVTMFGDESRSDHGFDMNSEADDDTTSTKNVFHALPPRRNSEANKGNLKTITARLVSVFAISSVLLFIAMMTGLLVVQSFRRVKDNWEVYRRGVELWGNDFHGMFGAVFKRVPSKMFDDVAKDLGKGVQDLLYGWLGDVVNNVSHVMFECLLTLLYMMFWLCSPMPIRGNLDRLFRRYSFILRFI